MVPEQARAALMALEPHLRVTADRVMEAPNLYADEVHRAYRLFAKAAKLQNICAWKTRMRQSWATRGSLVYKWVKQKAGVLTLAVRDHDGQVLTSQREIVDCLEQYWADTFRHEQGDASTHLDTLGQCWLRVDELVEGFQTKARAIPRCKSGGMDGFGPSHFRALDKSSIRCLLHIVAAAVFHHKWPVELLSVKLRLLPKVNDALLEPRQFRPISVASLTFRTIEHVLLRKETLDAEALYHRGQLGGIGGRSIHLGLYEVSTCIAHAHAFAEVDYSAHDDSDMFEFSIMPKYGVLLDVKQFFDSLAVADVVEVLSQCGISQGTLAFLLTWYLTHTKCVHFGGTRGEIVIRPGRGAPQGSYFSVLGANLLVARWLRLVEHHIPRALCWTAVDDRHVLCESLEELQHALDLTSQFDGAMGWDLQVHKSQWWAIDTTCAMLELHAQGQPVAFAEEWTWLGMEFSSSNKKPVTKRNKRFNDGLEILTRLQRAPF
eukprot:6490314-Amphidinium_carterae.4